jgi:hypothetical protein
LAYDPFKLSCQTASSATVCAEPKKTTTNPVINALHVTSSIIASIAGLAAVIIIILSGLTLVTSAGNPEASAKARKRITYAIVGLIVIALAYSLVTFVVDKVIQ